MPKFEIRFVIRPSKGAFSPEEKAIEKIVKTKYPSVISLRYGKMFTIIFETKAKNAKNRAKEIAESQNNPSIRQESLILELKRLP